MIDAPHGLTLHTTDAPRPDRRRTATPPTLTVERGPRVAGRSGVTLEPAPSRFNVFCSTTTKPGQVVYMVCAITPDGRMDADGGRNVLAEVHLTGVGMLGKNAGILFLADLCDQLNDTGFDP